MPAVADEPESRPPSEHPFEVPSVKEGGDKSLRFARQSSRASNDKSSINKEHRELLKENLKRSISAIRSSWGAAQGFKTLRDYSSIQIDANDLKHVKKLGQGAFGVVDCCIFKPQQCLVAVKHLRADILLKNNDELEALKMEIALLRKLQNQHIINFIGFGSYNTSSEEEAGKTMFLVEEYADGGTLKSLMTKQMRTEKDLYRLRDGVRWLIGIAKGLKYLHERSPMVIHRDLKLENILLKGTAPEELECKIADFGLSALVSNHINASVQEAPTTETGAPASSPEGATEAAAAKPGGGNPDKPREAPREGRKERRNSGEMAQQWTAAAKRRVSTLMLPNMPVPKAHKEGEPAEEAENLPSMPTVPETATSRAARVKLRVSAPDQRLSGRTGTLMYMAPEVYMKEPYNDKADVFSFSVIAYEVLHRYQMICVTNGSLFECQTYARRVARAGFRPPIDEHLPVALAELISKCWKAAPSERPSMAEVVDALTEIYEKQDWDVFEKKHTKAKKAMEESCCSIS